MQVRLGSGSTAHVYACRHSFGFGAALKVLHPHLATNETRRAAFLEQGYLSNQLQHPCLVRIFNDGETDEGPYLVMDRVEGESLDARLRRQGRMPTAQALDLAERLLAFLGFIHGEGLFHRRLNPTEVLLEPSGAVRVIDFDAGHGHDTYAHRAVSLSPPTSRTATYFPPELSAAVLPRGIDAGRASDIWALGALLYRALAGFTPFVSEVRTPGTLDFVSHREGPHLGDVRPDLPSDLTDAVERALLGDPGSRFSTAEEMRSALQDARAVMSVGSQRMFG